MEFDKFKMYGSKATTRNTHGDPRPTPRRRRARAGKSQIEKQARPHPQAAKTNEQAAAVEKLSGVPRDVHASPRDNLVANSILAVKAGI